MKICEKGVTKKKKKMVSLIVPDSRNSGLPLINSSWQVPAIVAIYLLTVLKIGPRFMENRKAYDLKNVIWSYNLFQILANGALFFAEVSPCVTSEGKAVSKSAFKKSL